jgi:hypothetical protein
MVRHYPGYWKQNGKTLPRILKNYTPKSRRTQQRPMKRLLDKWDRKGSTSGPISWQLHDDDDDDDDSNLALKASQTEITFIWVNDIIFIKGPTESLKDILLALKYVQNMPAPTRTVHKHCMNAKAHRHVLSFKTACSASVLEPSVKTYCKM